MSPWRRHSSDLLGWLALFALAGLVLVAGWLAVVLAFSLG